MATERNSPPPPLNKANGEEPSPPHKRPMTTSAQSYVNDPVVLTWTIHRLRERPRMLLLVIPCLLLTGFAGSRMLGSPLAGLFAAGVLAAAIGDYLFPVRYELRRRTASAACLFSRHEIPWERVRSVWVSEEGVKLSPLGKPSRLEAFRGVFLRFGPEREQVIEAVKHLRARAAEAEE